MKKWIICVMATACGLLNCWADTRGYLCLSVEAFEKHISDENVIRVDVRTASEYAQGHLPDAVNIDMRDPNFAQKALSSLPQERTIAVYCRSGRRSKTAAVALSQNGFRVIELNEGFIGWTKANKPSTQEATDLFKTKKGTCIYAYHIKHGSLKFKIGKKWLYIDPVANAVQPATDFSAMPKADAILLTHEHYDHLDTAAIRQLTKKGTRLITNARCQEVLGKAAEPMKNGDTKTIVEKWKVEAVPAYNTSSAKEQYHPKGRDNGYVLTVNGFRIYIAGDTEVTPEMEGLKNIDVAFLPCNLPYTMNAEQFAKAAKTISPKVLFPYHCDKSLLPEALKLLEGSGIEIRTRN